MLFIIFNRIDCRTTKNKKDIVWPKKPALQNTAVSEQTYWKLSGRKKTAVQKKECTNKFIGCV